jgi:parvulin-like peptidyl-prolyl isomerase
VKKILVMVGVAIILSGCGSVLAPPAARLDGREISAKSVTEAVNRFEKTAQFAQAAQQSSKSAVARQYEQSYLSRIIRRYVLGARARRLHVVVTHADVQAALSQIERNFPSQEAFQKALEQQGLTLDQLGPLVRDRVLETKLRTKVTADVAPSTQELKAYYQQHLSDYRQVLVSHILVAKHAKAQQIADRLHRTDPARVPALFSKLARAESTDKASAAKGGELGPLTPGSNSFVPPFSRSPEAG